MPHKDRADKDVSVVRMAALGPSSGRLETRVQTYRQRRDAGIVRQRYDYSCGAAALATLLLLRYQDVISEETLVHELLASLPKEQAQLSRKQGFSLLDLQRVAQARGYKAQGFRITPEQLEKLKGPVLVFIAPQGYRHFAVLKYVSFDRVLVADPARGNVRQPLYAFINDWQQPDGTGIVFVIEPAGDATAVAPYQHNPAELKRPEILSASEMLHQGSHLSRLPELRQ